MSYNNKEKDNSSNSRIKGNNMAKMNFNSDTLFSAVKRKNVRDMLVFVLAEVGETEASEIMASKTRVTDAAILEVRNALVGIEREDVADITEDDAEETAPDDLTYADEDVQEVMDTLEDKVNDLEKAITKGKKKKAKKLLAELEDAGLSGSELKRMKKQIKGL